MNLSLTLSIVSFILIITIFLIRYFELKKDNYLLPKKVRSVGDSLILKTSLAVSRNVVRIQKMIYKEISLFPRRFFKLTHLIWSKFRNTVDRIYDRLNDM